MKIALVSFGYSDSIIPLFKHLKYKAIEIDLIFCYSLNRKSDSILNFTDKKISTGFLSEDKIKEILPEGIKKYLSDISSVKFFVFHNLKLRSFKNFLLSLSLVKKLKTYNIIHFNGSNGILSLLIFLLRKKKLVFTIHDIHSHSGEKARFNFAEKLNKFLIKSKYPLIVQNKLDYKYLNQKYPKISEKFKFIPFGVLDIFREFKTLTNETPLSDLLFFGRISQYKGIEYLLDAIRGLNSQGIMLKTIIAGQGDTYFKKDDLGKLGVKLINRYIPNEELVALIEGTKIVICPYTDATQSGVVMTAFAFNKPVIASDVGNFHEIVKDGITGFLVRPKDSDALALKIAQIISDTTLLEQMQTNIQSNTTSGEYSWSQIAIKMKELYASILSERFDKPSHSS